jgi:hypothetical protein
VKIVDAVAAYGPTRAVVQRQFYKGLVAIIDSIKVTDVKQEVHICKQLYSVEVRKNVGTIYLGLYENRFDGEVYSNCCWDEQDVTMTVTVKVWKFATLRNLKEDFERLRNAK